MFYSGIPAIAIKGLIRTKPVVEPARSAGSTTGYGFYLLNPCCRALIQNSKKIGFLGQTLSVTWASSDRNPISVPTL